MSYLSERDEFLQIMTLENIPLSVSKYLLRYATTLQRLAELSCSSQRANHDQVRCPEASRVVTIRVNYGEETCLCRDAGTYDAVTNTHGRIPRIDRKAWQTERTVLSMCIRYGLVPKFGGDPRGNVLMIKVPSGWTNDWSREGICVPARGYSAAELERRC